MGSSAKELWRTALGEIELSLSRASFKTWFQHTTLESVVSGIATIRVPNGFTKEWLQNKYNKIVFRALRNLSSDVREVRYILVPDSEQRDVAAPTAAAESFAAVSLHEDRLLFDETTDRRTNLNPRYAFESFVVASSNELAHAAAQAVAKRPGDKFNPLFIYGGVGLGKTHLLQAIGNASVRRSPTAHILYTTAETFTNDLVVSLMNRRMEELKNRYNNLDLLIIDDIQFLAGKEKTQAQFFHTFNALYERNHQIVLSSDRPPRAIPTLEDRLYSRFEGGMIADVNPPDLETRIAILRKKIGERDPDVVIPETVIEVIASAIQRNVRELEGALNRVIIDAEIKERPPTVDEVQQLLRRTLIAPRPRHSAASVINVVAEFYNIPAEELCDRSRKKEIVKPRQIAMYLLRTELENSFPAIGAHLGNRDHTTAMYACQKVEELIKESPSFAQEISALRDRVRIEEA